MKYYTKEWYRLCQTPPQGLYRKIPDREYTDGEIRSFYERALQKEIANDESIHNTPPIAPETLASEDAFRSEDWMIFGEDGQGFHPRDYGELMRFLQAEYAENMRRFNERPPFDPTPTVECFQESYRNLLRYMRRGVPAWLAESVDHRLLALYLLPESAWERYERETRAARETVEAISARAREELSRQDVPEAVQKALWLHDACLLSLRKAGRDLVMLVTRDDGPEDTPYRRVVFRDATILERDPALRPRKRMGRYGWRSSVIFLYDELYRVGEGFEAHMLFHSRRELAYLTVACREILYEECKEI